MIKKIDNSSLVYSTEHGMMCPTCGKPLQKCGCIAKKQTSRQGKEGVRVALETKGRKGSGVSLITDIPASPDDIKTLAKTLKQKCGSGGTVKNGTIEIQGDHRDFLVEALKGLGYKVKRIGN